MNYSIAITPDTASPVQEPPMHTQHMLDAALAFNDAASTYLRAIRSNEYDADMEDPMVVDALKAAIGTAVMNTEMIVPTKYDIPWLSIISWAISLVGLAGTIYGFIV